MKDVGPERCDSGPTFVSDLAQADRSGAGCTILQSMRSSESADDSRCATCVASSVVVHLMLDEETRGSTPARCILLRSSRPAAHGVDGGSHHGTISRACRARPPLVAVESLAAFM